MASRTENTAAAGTELVAALYYAGAGIKVFPVDIDKAPLTPNGFKDATTDREQIETWWSKFPDAGIATADFDVVDVDLYKPGCAETWKTIKPLIPKGTPQTITGGDGRQLFFAPGTLRDGKIGDGIDNRYAGRNYVILPPSLHRSGRRYEMVESFVTQRPKPAPDFPSASGESGEFEHLLTQMQNGDTITDGRNKATWWQAVRLIQSATGPISIEKLHADVEAWVRANCAGDLNTVDVAKQVRGALRFANDKRAEDGLPPHAVNAVGKPTLTATCSLEEVVAVFRKWLHLPDPRPLYAALSVVVANRMPGDPVWLLLVAASSSGKTEILVSLTGLEEIEAAATLTEAALLSGVSRKDRAPDATGGLLRKIGPYGILTLKDFGSVLSMNRDSRAAVLAALREVYDGAWDRHVGVDGGRTLHWDGKLGLIGGVTTVVDRHHAVMDALGSRFLLYRIEIDDRQEQARRSLEHRLQTKQMREELRATVTAFFAGLEIPQRLDSTLTATDIRYLIELADFATLARSPVERDGYSREIELIPDPEAPARFAGMLAALLGGLRVIGVSENEAWRLVRKSALDSLPAQRRRLLEYLSTVAEATTKEAAVVLGLPTTTARRALEELAAHGIVLRKGGSEGDVWGMQSRIPLG